MNYYDEILAKCHEIADDEKITDGWEAFSNLWDWLEEKAAQQGIHPTPLTLFGMRVEIAKWLKPGQWFIRPTRRG